MDFHSLARRDLQALCKLNAIPANMTNVAMADALAALDIVEGLEDFLNRSPERKAVTAAKVPRTGRRTATQSKPIGDGSESVQPMTMSTRRSTRRGISDEIMAESMTPAIRSSRKTVEPVKAESERIENVEKKDVSDSPALATYSRRNQVAARKSSVKEVSTVQRAYSTRRSARLTENITVEEKEEKINSLVSELSRIDLKDGLDNKSLSEVVLQESVEKSNGPSETLNNLKDNEALDEVNAVQEDSTKSLVIENEKDVDALEEVLEEFEEKPKQLVESQFVADSVVIKNENNEVLEYPVDTENSYEETKSDEAAPESGLKEDAQEIVADELKEKSEQCFDTLDDNLMIKDEDSKVEKSLMDSDNTLEQLDLGAGEGYETNKNLESDVKATAELSDGGDSYLVEEHRTYSDESKDEILENNDHADLTEDEMETEEEMDSEAESMGESEVVQQVSCFEESKADILNNNDAEEIATGTEIRSVAPLVSSGGAESKPVTKTLVSDDKENIDRNGIKFELTKEAKKDKKETVPAANELNAKSLRELTKMLKEKLQISNNTEEDIGKVTKERPALQKIEDNCQW
ncbi:uncharacterized protein LOC108218387 [Daucus carota subsp. sativus]|uniref:uncharacterized protein LOC108218387 n=1 Tax=Daucus carota subsp. sativus TaxID=79200 RepID=UPI0007B1B3FF|nr:PREDICTED: uncharacterized protein LOC108218387 isoform X2 [Daucus carota subsp. sativus]